MRLFLLIGTLLIITGTFVFTRGVSLRWFFMVPGTVIGLFGVLAVALGISILCKKSPSKKAAFRRVGARPSRIRVAAATA